MTRVLVLNGGSSSLKYALFEDAEGGKRAASGAIERVPEGGHARALEEVLRRIEEVGGLEAVAAVGHRVVHGGASLRSATRIDDAVLEELCRLLPLDPAHLPAEIAIVEAVRSRAPALPQVACFDTAFHAAMPRVSTLLPVPRAYEARGVRRYGFHGLSYTYVMGELARIAGEPLARGRVVVAHLGSGASLAAVRDGAPVDTTMSFTPNSGVPMGTRSGDLDPGLVAYLARAEGERAVEEMLERRSGLLGVSGTSADMRDLLAREAQDAAAADAIALFCHSVRKAIGALATTIDGLDALVFTAGIGERSPVVRARICAGLAQLGVRLDERRNDASELRVSSEQSPCAVFAIPTDEEAVIAREAARVVAA